MAKEYKEMIKEALSKSKGKCEECGIDLLKEEIRPECHHKDGNSRNNDISNIEVLCPNCHSKHKEKQKSLEEEEEEQREEDAEVLRDLEKLDTEIY